MSQRKYTIVEYSTAKAVCAAVGVFLDEGWTVYGNLIVMPAYRNEETGCTVPPQYIQAMVK